MPLTDVAIRNAKPRSKPYKISDAAGMYLEVSPAGGKVFRLKYRIGGKEKRLTLGAYPTCGLSDARMMVADAKRKLQNGIDPGEVKKAEKADRVERASNSFAAVAREWHTKQVPGWSEKHAERVWARLENNFIPWLGDKPVAAVTNDDVRQCLRRVEDRGSHFMVKTCFQTISQVLGYAVANDLSVYVPPKALLKTFTAHVETHMAALTTPKQFAGLLRLMDGFTGSFTVQSALRLLPLVFVRTQELRMMKWEDLKLDGRDPTWTIPAAVMKMRQDHIVPLSKQAAAILKDLHPLNGHLEYVFPGGRDPKRPMSDAAINAALRRLGVDTKTEHTGHGFRASARTLLHEELGFPADWIEAQLAHQPSGSLGDTYARVQFLPQRRKMMQGWADYLGNLKAGGNVIAIGAKRKKGAA